MTTLVDCPDYRFGDWNFRILGVPVTVKIWFWLAVLLVGGQQELGPELLWIAICFVSILLHELGHVCAFRLFRERSEIVLYGWGGMTISSRGSSGPFARVVVALAGPFFGFCVAGATLLAAGYLGESVRLTFRMLLPVLSVIPSGTGYSTWQILVNELLWVNFYWGLVNLLPIYPLDGGHAARAIFEQADPRDGGRKSLILSATLAGALVICGVMERSLYLVLMFAILAVSSLQMLEGWSGGAQPHRSRSPR